jgi:hypothetical protein
MEAEMIFGVFRGKQREMEIVQWTVELLPLAHLVLDFNNFNRKAQRNFSTNQRKNNEKHFSNLCAKSSLC